MLRTTLPLLAVGAFTLVAGAQEPPRPTPLPRPAPSPAPLPWPAIDALEQARMQAELAQLQAEHLMSIDVAGIELRALELEHAIQLQQELRMHDLAPMVHDLAPMVHDLVPHVGEIEPLVHELGLRVHELAPRAFDLRAPFVIELPESPFPEDPADSLYRAAREMLNRGEYRRAAQTFRQISDRFATSRYAPDALYYEAFALYRIGTVAEMRAALGLLEQQRESFPRSQRDREAASLAMRIRGELAANGDARAASDIAGIAGTRVMPIPDRIMQIPDRVVSVSNARRTSARSTTQQGPACDRDSMAVKLEALSALSRIDSPEVTPALRRVLQRRDECSASLRRRAVLLLGQQAGAEMGSVLIDVARNDPDDGVKQEAINMLARVPTDEAVDALQTIVRSGDSRASSSAMRALGGNSNPRAREAVRTVLERNDVAESIRLSALASFRRASPEEAAYLRSVYPRLESRRLRSQAITTIARLGGTENEQWLLALARNDAEAMELRATALDRIATSAPIAEVGRLYDQAGDRRLKQRIIARLGSREEPEAVDKLIAIARNDQDVELRRAAIERLARKKDPRATQLLLEIIGR